MQPSHTKVDLKKQILEGNQVIVRVWTSQANLVDAAHSVGHVSVETKKGIYWSLWPRLDAAIPSGKGIVKPISKEPIESFTYQKDRDLEGRDPELVFCFYTLDTDAMESKFEEFLKDDIQWNFLGRLFFLNSGSCASSAWELLQAGGINSIAPRAEQSSVSTRGGLLGLFSCCSWSARGARQQLSSNQQLANNAINQSMLAASYGSEMAVSPLIKSPDYIGELLKKAKAKELEKEPLTSTVIFTEETPSAQLQPI